MTNSNDVLISVCIPLYKCESTIKKLYQELILSLEKIDKNNFEIIFVDDCSPYKDWEIVKEIADNDARVKGIHLSKNQGQHPAIFAGLSFARGVWVVVMDGDMQDHPKEIYNLYELAISKNYKKVLARRNNRKDTYFKKIQSKYFHRILGFMTGTKLDSSVANYGIYHRDVIKAVCKMGDRIKCFPVMVSWVGFKAGYLDVEHGERYAGESSYNTIRLLKLASGIIVSFSEKPLRGMVFLGFIISIISFLVAFYYLFLALFHRFQIRGWASLIVSIWFSTGLLVFCLGILGIYLGKIFESVKNRPVYIVEEEYERKN